MTDISNIITPDDSPPVLTYEELLEKTIELNKLRARLIKEKKRLNAFIHKVNQKNNMAAKKKKKAQRVKRKKLLKEVEEQLYMHTSDNSIDKIEAAFTKNKHLCNDMKEAHIQDFLKRTNEFYIKNMEYQRDLFLRQKQISLDQIARKQVYKHSQLIEKWKQNLANTVPYVSPFYNPLYSDNTVQQPYSYGPFTNVIPPPNDVLGSSFVQPSYPHSDLLPRKASIPKRTEVNRFISRDQAIVPMQEDTSDHGTLFNFRDIFNLDYERAVIDITNGKSIIGQPVTHDSAADQSAHNEIDIGTCPRKHTAISKGKKRATIGPHSASGCYEENNNGELSSIEKWTFTHSGTSTSSSAGSNDVDDIILHGMGTSKFTRYSWSNIFNDLPNVLSLYTSDTLGEPSPIKRKYKKSFRSSKKKERVSSKYPSKQQEVSQRGNELPKRVFSIEPRPMPKVIRDSKIKESKKKRSKRKSASLLTMVVPPMPKRVLEITKHTRKPREAGNTGEYHSKLREITEISHETTPTSPSKLRTSIESFTDDDIDNESV